MITISHDEQILVDLSCKELWGENWENVSHVDILRGGLSGACVFRIKQNENNYVLRFFPKSLSQEHRESICHVMKATGEQEIAPYIYFVSSDSNLVIMEFLLGQTLHPNKLQNHELLLNFGKIMAQAHQLQIDVKPAQFWIHSSSLNWFEDYQEQWNFMPEMEELYETSLQIYDLVETVPYEIGLCHGDPNALNILYIGNEIKLIDWDSAHNDNVWREIANIFNWFAFTKKQEEIFFQGYLGRQPDEEEQALLYMMKVLDRSFSIFGWLLWDKRIDFEAEGWRESYSTIDTSILSSMAVMHAEGEIEKNPKEFSKNFLLASLKQFFIEIESKTFFKSWKLLTKK